MENNFDLVGNIIDYESGNMDLRSVLNLFSHLIKTGTAWTLQGCYGRMATQLIDNGFISKQGEILRIEDE